MNIFRRTTTNSESETPKSIYDFARTVKTRFDEVAHPTELLSDEKWRPAVDALAAGSLTTSELLSFALGDNERVASLALATLGARKDESAIAPILEQINSYSGDWPKYFALAALNEIVPAPQSLLGRLLIALDGDWSDRRYERFMNEFIRDLVRRRIAAGEPATFGDALASRSSVTTVRDLLATMDSDLVEPLRRELDAHDAQRTDVDYLRTIGKIWRDEEDAPLDHELLEKGASFIEQTLIADHRRSVLVIGEDGAGKSTVIHAAAQRLRKSGWIIFEAGGPEIVAGMVYFGEVEKRVQKILKQLGGARR